MAGKKPKSPSNKKEPKGADPKKEPKGEKGQLQAVHDDISKEVVNLSKVIQLEQELNNRPINRLLGVGGDDLDGFIKQHTSGFADVDPGNELAKRLAKDKESRPVLKKVSQEESWERTEGAGSQSPKNPSKSPGKSGKK